MGIAEFPLRHCSAHSDKAQCPHGHFDLPNLAMQNSHSGIANSTWALQIPLGHCKAHEHCSVPTRHCRFPFQALQRLLRQDSMPTRALQNTQSGDAKPTQVLLNSHSGIPKFTLASLNVHVGIAEFPLRHGTVPTWALQSTQFSIEKCQLRHCSVHMWVIQNYHPGMAQ